MAGGEPWVAVCIRCGAGARESSGSGGAGLARAASGQTVTFRGRPFCRASGFPSPRAKPACNPLRGPQNALKERWKIEVGVDLREMYAKPRRGNLYGAQLRRCCLFKTFSIAWRKGQLKVGAKSNQNPPDAAIIACTHGTRKRRLEPAPPRARLLELVTLGHGFSPIRAKVLPGSELGCVRSLQAAASKSRNFREA
jgi:hypothetical protein